MDQPSASTSTDYSESNKCSICSLVTPAKLINVGTLKGKESLQNASIERGDELFEKVDFSKIILVHASCRSDYVHKIKILAAKRKLEQQKSEQLTLSPVQRKLRKPLNFPVVLSDDESIPVFNWKETCFICSKKQT